ncbi:polyribonucleotide nucleotidyltransferase [Anaerosphaera sp. HMSC064C01]|nr:polyribonucleotide nucleotidyltransferase [Anaerosphaera sp. HMSC064C01]
MQENFKTTLAGRPLEIETGKMCEQAGGSCLVKYGDTYVLVNATSTKAPREGVDFFPLSVDYEEKFYSVGKIPGGYIKREGRPSEKAVLTSRLIDRPIRPLFPEGFFNDVQVIATVLSVDPDNSPEIAAMIGSSVALCISDIPFNGPTAAVYVGLIDGEYVINPKQEEMEKSDINLCISGTKDAIMMVESGSNEVSEDQMIKAILKGHEAIKEICKFEEEIIKKIGKEKYSFEKFEAKEEIFNEIDKEFREDIKDSIFEADKIQRIENSESLKDTILNKYLEKYPEDQKSILKTIDDITSEEFRKGILERNLRPDGRNTEQIRPLSAEVGLLPRAHGSGLFKRGQTQVLTIATLGSFGDSQSQDGLVEEGEKHYMHQYNFPPYSVGDVRPLRSPGRREIGHGALAERALVPVIPTLEEFPYTIRLVSEVLSSNGSSSQASICGSTLALMDAGVPIKKPVAGIAMGLIKSDANTKILTDIQGLEDHLGDMDFKVAGTKDGITAMQMDIKVQGIDEEIMKVALEQAKKARFEILGVITSAISEPRKELSEYAPKIATIKIDPDKIRDVIGSGGKVINKIIEETGAKIDITDDGDVYISADTTEGLNGAKKMIEDIVKEVEVGEVYFGKVNRITNFGAFVEVLNGKEGLLHISQISKDRVNKVEDVLKLGDEIMVKVTSIDEQGRINLSRKALVENSDGESK